MGNREIVLMLCKNIILRIVYKEIGSENYFTAMGLELEKKTILHQLTF